MGGALLRKFGQMPAAGGGFAAWPSLIGAEMMINGDCSSGTGWTLGGGLTIAAGKMTATVSTSTAVNSGALDVPFVNGIAYRTVFTIDTASLGSVQPFIGITAGTSRSTVNTFTQDIVAAGVPGGDGWVLYTTSATMQLDNFSVKSVGGLGVTADWSFSGAFITWRAADSVSPDVISFAEPPAGDKAELTGSAKTAFDAGVSNSTACSVSLTASEANPIIGTVSVTLKGGTPVSFVFSGAPSEVVTDTVTSGTGSGFVLTAVGFGVSDPLGDISRIQVSL